MTDAPPPVHVIIDGFNLNLTQPLAERTMPCMYFGSQPMALPQPVQSYLSLHGVQPPPIVESLDSAVEMTDMKA